MTMLTEQQLDEYLKVFDARMQGVTDQYLRMIGEHLKAIGELTPSDVHRLTQLKQMHTNVRKIKREIAKAANLSMADIETAFEAAAASNERFMREYYERATGHDISGSTERSEPLKRIIEAQANVTDQAMQNLSNTTVIEGAYRDVIDVAVQTVQGGVTDYKSAIRSAMTAAAKNGLRVEYESGYTRRLDSAVRQNVLDGVRSLNNDMLKQLGKEYGADGIEISAHMLCAEDHLPYQGRQFTNEQFERIQANLRRPFGQWNCKHTIFPIIMGVSVQALDEATISRYNEMSTQPITIDGKTRTRYEWSQVQRKIETAVREQKDIVTVAKASGDRKAERKARSSVSALMDYYDKISEESRIKQEYGRMAAWNTKTGGSKNASNANNGASGLTFSTNGSIIITGNVEQEIREYIKTDAVNKTVNPEKQRRHIKGSAEYVEGRSYIFGGITEAQELVNAYHGTGIPKITRKGEWSGKEFVIVDHTVGVDVDKDTGDETQTNRFYIHYSKTGAHIVPTKRDG